MSARTLIATAVAAAVLSALVVGTGTPVVFADGPAEEHGRVVTTLTVPPRRASLPLPPPPRPPRRPPTPTATPTPTTPVSSPPASVPTSAGASPSPSTLPVSCPLDVTATYADSTYCRGSLADVVTGRYGAGVRVLLSAVTVHGVTPGGIDVSGASACPSDPSGQPTYCGATLWGLAVATDDLATLPEVGEVVDLYGVTGPNGTFSATGFIHIGWCALEWGDC